MGAEKGSTENSNSSVLNGVRPGTVVYSWCVRRRTPASRNALWAVSAAGSDERDWRHDLRSLTFFENLFRQQAMVGQLRIHYPA